MLTTLRSRAIIAAALLLALSACGDDDPSGPGRSTLSERQSVEMFNAFMEVSNAVMATASLNRALPIGISATAEAGALDISGTCPLGGSINFQGSFSGDISDSGTGTVTFDLTETPNACKTNASSGPVTFTGDPNLRVTYALSLRDEKPTLFRWTLKGGLGFAGGVSGSCVVDMDYSLDYQTQKFTMTGTMCGNQIRSSN